MVPALRTPSAGASSRLFAALSVVAIVAAAGYLLAPDPLSDVFFAGWVLVAVGLAVVGGVAAWTDRTPLLWVAALSLAALSVVGMWSIGFLVAPAALLLLGAAALSQVSGSHAERRARAVSTTPSDAVLRPLGGVAAVGGGGWLVYASAFRQELFGACASETLACVLGTTHWAAVGTTVLGLAAVGVGCWLLWKYVYVGRLLGSRHAG